MTIPNEEPDAIDQEKIDDVRRFMASFFTPRIGRSRMLRTASTPTRRMRISSSTYIPRIRASRSGPDFSGHGFKFGPLTGRLLAELAWEGKTSIPEAEMARRLFSLKK